MAVKKVEKTEKVKKVAAPKKPKAVKAVEVAEEKVVKATPVKAEKAVKKTAEKYFYAVGRRKTSVAQVRLYEYNKTGEPEFIVNEKKLKDFFPTLSLQTNILQPLKTVGMSSKVYMTVLVRGGGFTGQAEAVRLGIARALVKMNEEFKKTLKDAGFLTRDSREVERKKPGLKKARKAPQWAKR